MRLFVILTVMFFTQQLMAIGPITTIEHGIYLGQVEKIVDGGVVDTGIFLKAYIQEKSINGEAVTTLELYNEAHPHKSRTSTYVLQEESKESGAWSNGKVVLQRKGSFDEVSPIRYRELITKRKVAPILITLKNNMQVILYPDLNEDELMN